MRGDLLGLAHALEVGILLNPGGVKWQLAKLKSHPGKDGYFRRRSVRDSRERLERGFGGRLENGMSSHFTPAPASFPSRPSLAETLFAYPHRPSRWS